MSAALKWVSLRRCERIGIDTPLRLCRPQSGESLTHRRRVTTYPLAARRPRSLDSQGSDVAQDGILCMAAPPPPAPAEPNVCSAPGIPSPPGSSGAECLWQPDFTSRQLAQVLSQLWRDAAADKRIARFPLGRGCKLYQQRRAAAFKDGDGLAVPEQDPV